MTAENPVQERRITIVQGEHCVTTDPSVVLVTLLGSCVAACLRDPGAGIGGMNHFLLPGDAQPGNSWGQSSTRNAVHAMELLVNELLRGGARRSHLEAKVFGGARMMRGLTDVGEHNSVFAEQFLRAEGIPIVGGSLRGARGRRIQYWPITGRARQIGIGNEELSRTEGDRPVRPMPSLSSGSLELF